MHHSRVTPPNPGLICDCTRPVSLRNDFICECGATAATIQDDVVYPDGVRQAETGGCDSELIRAVVQGTRYADWRSALRQYAPHLYDDAARLDGASFPD